MKPEKGTPEWGLWVAAVEVAISATLKQHSTTYAAKVPWSTINELRAALDALDIDWREVHPETRRNREA